MRKIIAGLLFLLPASCQMLGESVKADEAVETGELRIAFDGDVGTMTRNIPDIPDTSDFLLTVTDADGTVIYDGAYGASPESMMVDAGSYTVKVRSCDFTRPAFSLPQFGDEQCVVVPAGGVADVKMTCRQLNSGVLLRIDESFLTGCPDGLLFLKSAEGKLMYGYSERRVAYFLPGTVSLMLSENGSDRILMTRLLQPQDILKINVSVSRTDPSHDEESIRVAVDTSRNWITEDFVIGDDNGDDDDDISSALTVVQATASVGKTGVWVCGYIAGGDLTSSSASFEPPFTSRTNLLLASRASVSDRSSCLSVQLPAGRVRDALNLVDNPSMLGRKVYVKGDIEENYYGLTGLKNVSDYEK